MDFRPRWSVHYQITLLAVVITIGSIYIAGRLAESTGKHTLLTHELVDLGDDTNLRANEMESEFLQLGRAMRDVSTRLGTVLADEQQMAALSDQEPWLALRAQDPVFLQSWQEQMSAMVSSRDPNKDPAGKKFNGDAVDRILLYDWDGKLVGGSEVVQGVVGPFGPRTPRFGGEVLASMIDGGRSPNSRAAPVVDASGFVLEDDHGRKVCRLYLVRRVYRRTKQGHFDITKSTGLLVVAVDVSRYLTEIAFHSPRHTYYLLDSEGIYLHHPDPTVVGQSVRRELANFPMDPFATFTRSVWGKENLAEVEDRLGMTRGDQIGGENRLGIAIPGLDYFHAKKKMPRLETYELDVADAHRKEFNEGLAAFARTPFEEGGPGPGLRYSEVTAFTSRMEISHPTENGLDRTRSKIDELLATWPQAKPDDFDWILTRWPFNAPGTDWYPTLHCERFVAQLTMLPLDLSEPLKTAAAAGKPTPPSSAGYVVPPGNARLIAVAAVAEIKQDAVVIAEPERKFTQLVVGTVAALLAFGLSLYVARPLHRISEAAHTLASGAKQIAESEVDPNKSGERFIVDLPSDGPREVRDVADAFREMVRQLERMTARIRRRTAEMQTVLRTAVDGVVLFSEKGEIETANPAAEAMFGYGPGELVETRIQNLMQMPAQSSLGLDPGSPSDSGSRFRSATDSASDGRGSLGKLIRMAGLELKAVRKDGSEFWAEAGFNEVPLGDRVLYTGIVRDITERKKAQEEIQSMNEILERRVRERTALLEESTGRLEIALEQAKAAAKAKDTFVANMSHELRQPLNTVIGYAELLREEAEDEGNDAVIKHLDKILTAARHLLGLINDILDMAKIADEKLELNEREFALSRLVADLHTLADPLAKKNGNTLVFPQESNLGKMIGDELRIRQIMLNLMSNACKFTEKGTVTLSVEHERGPVDWIRFAITDTGRGMSQEQAGRLFQRFYQVDDSTRRQQGGTGLGLAITRSLCDLMGGSVTCTSEPGVGSVFTVRLPAKPLAPIVKEPRKELVATSLLLPAVNMGEAHGTHKTVLVIDDDPSALELMKRFLEKDGLQVYTAASGEQGLQLAKMHRPDLITLDVMMPGVAGWATLAALKTDATTYTIPVVMVTMIDDRGRGFALGATDYLTKPVDWQKLGATLRAYIPHPSAGPVLIVDDDADQVDLLVRMMTKEGWEVDVACNGQEGLDRVAARKPVLILLDLMMPVLDGFGFLSELHRRFPNLTVPVIVVTAKDLTEDDIKRLNGGVAHIVQKGSPQSLDEIIHRLRPNKTDGTEPPHA